MLRAQQLRRAAIGWATATKGAPSQSRHLRRPFSATPDGERGGGHGWGAWLGREVKILLALAAGGSAAAWAWRQRPGAPPHRVRALLDDADAARRAGDADAAAAASAAALAVVDDVRGGAPGSAERREVGRLSAVGIAQRRLGATLLERRLDRTELAVALVSAEDALNAGQLDAAEETFRRALHLCRLALLSSSSSSSSSPRRRQQGGGGGGVGSVSSGGGGSGGGGAEEGAGVGGEGGRAATAATERELLLLLKVLDALAQLAQDRGELARASSLYLEGVGAATGAAAALAAAKAARSVRNAAALTGGGVAGAEAAGAEGGHGGRGRGQGGGGAFGVDAAAEPPALPPLAQRGPDPATQPKLAGQLAGVLHNGACALMEQGRLREAGAALGYALALAAGGAAVAPEHVALCESRLAQVVRAEEAERFGGGGVAVAAAGALVDTLEENGHEVSE